MTETVLTATSNNDKVYHSRECQFAPDTSRELPKSEAEKLGYRECKQCKNGKPIVRDQQMGLRQRLEKEETA